MREIKRIFLKSMRLLRNKYIVIGCLFVSIILAIGATYSYIRVDLGWRLAGQMKFSELNYSINPSTITSPANSKTVYYNITITSINETNTRYLLTYKSTNADISVKVSSMSLNDASGIIGVYGNNTGVDKTRVVRIGITNNSATEGTVTLSVTGGYTWNKASSVKVPAGYTKVTETIKEEATLMGKTLSELINTKLNCTPTSTMPCLFKQNATENYVTYGGGNWRIVGTYLIGGEYVTKLILKEATNIESTYENVSTKLTEFYDGLTNTSVIRAGSPFTCTGTNTISCTGSSNIGLISKSEYDLVGGYNSYMYTLPNKEYWMNTEAGNYLLEVWGASGGTAVYSSTNYDGGYGGYSRGVVSLDTKETLYINVGGSTTTGAGGYNGGGTGRDSSQAGKGGGGGFYGGGNGYLSAGSGGSGYIQNLQSEQEKCIHIVRVIVPLINQVQMQQKQQLELV